MAISQNPISTGLGQFGQAWYVNGDVAPDLYLVKGQKYTFIVEGGLGTDQDGTIHPFYLTSDNEGGYGTKSDYEAKVNKSFIRLVIIVVLL